MSKLCDGVILSLREIFPELKIKTEHYVVYQNQKLFVDIWVPQLSLAVEVHGRQHEHFVPHFHQDAAGFKAHKKRDSLKEEWAGQEGIIYLVLYERDLPLTADKLLGMLKESK